MTDPLARVRRFLRELKRRNVYKVAVTYAVVAVGTLQAAKLIFPETTLAGFYDNLVVLAVVGFPLALVLAWAFEMTPEGVQRTPEAEGEAAEPSGGSAGGWIAALVLVVAGGGFWYLTAGGGQEAVEKTATATDTAATEAARSDTAGPPRIAVLPFENIAPDSTDDYFARGMHEEVLNQLSKVSGLEVISRTSVMRYADTDKPVPVISEELGGVTALLEGTVRRAGNQLRITTQLIKAPEDEHLWSKTYERTLSPKAIFDIQADIAQQIAGALETQLAGGEQRRIESVPTDDLAAYEAFLRGRGQVSQFWGRWTPELVARATRNLQEAVSRDSTFAEAHAWLGQAYVARVFNASAGEAPQWLDSASAAVERARRIDPDLAPIYLTQASIYRNQDSLQAEAEALRRALELHPSHPVAKAELSRNLAERGNHAEAVRMAREAVRLDPRRPMVLDGMADRLREVGLHDAAEAWYRHTLEIQPGYLAAYSGLAFIELDRGQPNRALAIWKDYFRRADSPPVLALFFASITALATDQPKLARTYILKGFPNAGNDHVSVGWHDRQLGKSDLLSPGVGLHVGFTELRLGEKSRGRRLLREAAASLRGQTDRGERLGRPYRVFLAGALAPLGRVEEALHQVQRAAEARTTAERNWLTWYPLLDTLRSNPRFQEIVRQVEARREEAREQIRRMDLDLYPPGAKPDTAKEKAQPDE